MYPSASGLFTYHNVFRVHPHVTCASTSFSSWLIFHCTDRPHFVYSSAISICPYTVCICHFIYSSVDGHGVVSTFWLWWIRPLCFESLFAILVGIYLGIELLSYMVILCLAFWGRKLTYILTQKLTLVGVYSREVIVNAPTELSTRLLIISTVSTTEKLETNQMISDME